MSKRFNQNDPSESTKKTNPPQTCASEQVSAEVVAAMYSVSMATARRRLKALEEKGRVTVLSPGGGRGREKLYDAREVRQHFRGRASASIASTQRADQMPEPISFSEWSAQWSAYRRWLEFKASATPGNDVSVTTESEASHASH